jgi:hypothetical protein
MPATERCIVGHTLDMTSARSARHARMGALAPRYSLVLNPHAAARFSSCPQCKTKTRLRKIPLVIHVDGAGLFVLRKTCRLCLACEMLLVHQNEIEPLIEARAGRAVSPTEGYFILGTVEPGVWRRRLSGGVALDELVQYMADFKAYLRVDYTPGGWYRST